MKIKEAKFFTKLFLKTFGYYGITLPPFGIYILKEHMSNERLIRHEKVHYEQYERMGFLFFYIKYIYYTLRYGYHKNPMEVEARERSY